MLFDGSEELKSVFFRILVYEQYISLGKTTNALYVFLGNFHIIIHLVVHQHQLAEFQLPRPHGAHNTSS